MTASESQGRAWYETYLGSVHWQELREIKVASVGHRCERCGEFARRLPWGGWTGLEVHHLTYERLGHEELTDLEVLCGPCHEEEHSLAVVDDGYRERWRCRIARRSEARVLEYYEEIDGLFALPDDEPRY